MNKKIILVGAGRRYSFVERLKYARYQVVALDTDSKAPISKECYVLQSDNEQTDKANIDFLIGANKDVYILPLSDKATVNIAQNPYTIGSDRKAAEICYDKRQFATFMTGNFPQYYPSIGYADKIIIKPCYGNSSKGIRYETKPHTGIIRTDEVAQKFITGTEYSVDTYFTKDNMCLGAIPRTRERVAGGEVIDSRTVNNQELRYLTATIGGKLNIRGPACFQYIVEDGTSKPYLFEINARFGGGCILSLEAGFNMIDMISKEYYENKIIFPDYMKNIKWGLYMRRVNKELFFNDNNM